MLGIILLAVFAASLFICIGFNISIFVSLGFGLIIFFVYGLFHGHSFNEMLKMCFDGIKTVKNILIAFILIGMLTALWRAGGTIPYIVYHATNLFDPAIMVLVTFILCSFVSFLTGTSFGTAATMGIICVTISNSMNVPLLFSGAAVSCRLIFRR